MSAATFDLKILKGTTVYRMYSDGTHEEITLQADATIENAYRNIRDHFGFHYHVGQQEYCTESNGCMRFVEKVNRA